ncbi:uncharacterized protein [Argopecten irradians]|uniref:uncharacterized protein n=1 Tax=Argopecten irradians TaxID=31199 RepID=UPI0037164B63
MITPDSLNITLQYTNSSNSTTPPPLPDDSGPPVEMPTIWDILEQYPTYMWSRYLGLYVYPIIIFLGTVGNVISFVVMIRKTMIHSSTCFYLAVIAVVDTLVLFFSGIRSWFAVINGWDAIILSPTACKVFNFLTYFLFQYSAWLLVAMTIERFIAIHFPLKAVEYATVSRAKKVSVALFVMFSLFNCHFFWTVTIEGQYCSPTKTYEDFHNDIFPLIDAVLYSFLPFLILLAINILIIRDNKRATRFRETLRRRSHTAENEKNMENRHFHQKLTITLLSVTFTFLVTSAPRVVLFSIRYNYFDFSSAQIDFERLALYLLVSRITSLFSYMNHAVNFLLYCITGQRFRRELRKLFVCMKQPSQSATLYSTSTDRYQRQSSATSISNLDMSENPSYPAHISHNLAYNTQTSHNPTYTSHNPTYNPSPSLKPNDSTQTDFLQIVTENNPTELFQNSNTDEISQNPDDVVLQNTNILNSNFDLSQHINNTDHLQNLNKDTCTQYSQGRDSPKHSQDMYEDNLAFSKTLNEENDKELSDLNEDNDAPSNYVNEENKEFSQSSNEDSSLHSQVNTEYNVTHSNDLNSDKCNMVEISQNSNEEDSMTISNDLNTDKMTFANDLNSDDITDISQNSNITDISQNSNEDNTTLREDLNENNIKLSQNFTESKITEFLQ